MVQLSETVEAADTEQLPSIAPKEAVKLFGRLAEKYIMLDSSGGMCCYSACSGEFLVRLYGGSAMGICWNETNHSCLE
jgi:hypothetical protein